jgi:DNA-binding CsgD family transcriptional regulator
VHVSPSVTKRPKIEAEQIVELYERIVPLLSSNPEQLDVASQINRWLREIVWYDFYHYVMDDPRPEGATRIDATIHRFVRRGDRRPDEVIEVAKTQSPDPDEDFARKVGRNYQQMIAIHLEKFPDDLEYHYHRIESREHPRIAIGFFRVKNAAKGNFTAEEKRTLKYFSPHLFALYRAALTQVYLSDAFQYFNSFARIGTRISNEFGLSDTETKLLPDILLGSSTEEIADKHYISVATVKTHIQHILKKTNTKSRLDFIGTFFTSPEHVKL